ncbi:hypothetical protein OPT61_g1273 [Boeremia exigua]|uniref:Uncharacterized protein n=1 Tax=Boeremia exigua TaxID=749465 RepID=A0ACC2IQW9_9PLEO|nr:hypothetical protein OPT61_g1273 [Boeremia exigua]
MSGHSRKSSGASDPPISAEGQRIGTPCALRDCANTMVDSAYQSMTNDSTPSIADEETTVGVASTVRLKPLIGTDLWVFKKGPAHADQFEYFDGIERFLESRIKKEVEDCGHELRHNTALRPLLLGKNELDAVVHILVLCPAYLEDLINRVLSREQTLLTVPHKGTVLRHLVIPIPPCSTSLHLDIDVCCQTGYVDTHDTHCGAQIVLTDHGAGIKRSILRQATFGGVVKASFGEGGGYATMACQLAMFSIRFMLSERNTTTTTDAVHGARDLVEWISSDNIVGRPLNPEDFPGITANRARLNYDWCLFGVANPRSNRAVGPGCDEVSGVTHSILTAEKPHFADEEPTPVLVLGAEGGSRHGELSNISARIWLAHCDAFVDAYILETDECEIHEGDSGSWVVHAAAAELYGHVVATNIFGEAYVMPAVETFANMRECLGATSVTLPSATDLPVKLNTQHSTTTRHAPEASDTQSLAQQASATELNKSLRSTKRWSQLFSEHNKVHDQPYLEAMAQVDVFSTILERFLSPPEDMAIPCWKLKQVRSSIDESQSKYENGLNHMYVDVNETAAWVRPGNLGSYLREGADTNSALHMPFNRKLFITSLEAQTLRRAMHMYMTSETRLGVHSSICGYADFRLECSLPFFMFSRTSTSPEKRLGDAKFDEKESSVLEGNRLVHLAQSVQEHSLSITIGGYSDANWHGFAFGDTSDDIDLAQYYEVEEPEDVFVEASNDAFATAGSQYTSDVRCTIWDPRIYFLRSVEARIGSVVKANEDVIHSLACETETWTWINFNSCNGDVSYLSDIEDDVARSYFHKIKKAFGVMKDMEYRLTVLVVKLKHSDSVLRLKMSRKATESALKSLAAAEERSRTDGINIQLLALTTFVVLTLQYFASERGLFDFERMVGKILWGGVSVNQSVIWHWENGGGQGQHVLEPLACCANLCHFGQERHYWGM